MSVSIATSVRNQMIQQIQLAIDAGLSAGCLQLYGGVRPSAGAESPFLLVTLICSDPCASLAVDGELTFNALSQGVATATGQATWGRFIDSSGNFIIDCSVNDREIVLNGNPLILEGQTVRVDMIHIGMSPY